MNKTFFALIAAMLVGAGCVPRTQPMPVTTGTSPTVDPLCVAEPAENEAGQPVYPIAEKYRAFPHLGQIFTAFDCNDRRRAANVAGFKNGTYAAGITLRGTNPNPSTEFKTVLTTLGFTQTTTGEWTSRHAFTLDELTTLKSYLEDPSRSGGLDHEDCVVCG